MYLIDVWSVVGSPELVRREQSLLRRKRFKADAGEHIGGQP